MLSTLLTAWMDLPAEHSLSPCLSTPLHCPLSTAPCRLPPAPYRLPPAQDLRVIDASHNQLVDLPGHFYKLENLEELNLSFNPLEKIPIEIGNLELLKDTQKWEVGG